MKDAIYSDLSALTLIQIGGEKPEKLLLFCDRGRVYINVTHYFSKFPS